MKKWNSGEECFIVVNHMRVVRAKVKRCSGEFCVIKLDTGAAIRLRTSRLFTSYQEAADHTRKPDNENVRKKTPCDYWQ